MEIINILLNFCEQKIVDFHNVINLRKIKSEVRKIILNRKNQGMITSNAKP
jgi:hypothetical protein